ncbi:MAG: sugar transferase [Cyanobacteria bacterium NC_groundwater_1444_Ag_S-0.65um_54_12]|nr:sugar transferase [Cyanobacteria bacterium NC_groundwater_1444_Ag_S-0.65um_54_12]
MTHDIFQAATRTHAPRGCYTAWLKPLLDFLTALVLLLALAPLLLLLAMLIRLDSPGPVLFRQDRVGRLGRLFRIVKFRTMRTGVTGPLLTQERDPRITRLGHFLRRSSLDELPQLFNILRGEMSFIGPRPELPQIVATEYTAEQKGVLAVRPGLSGWAQLHGRDDLAIPQKLAYDLEYVANLSWQLDLKILLLTPGLLLSGRGIKH